MFSDNSDVKLEINNRRISGKLSNMLNLKFKQHPSEITQIKGNVPREIKKKIFDLKDDENKTT